MACESSKLILDPDPRLHFDQVLLPIFDLPISGWGPGISNRSLGTNIHGTLAAAAAACQNITISAMLTMFGEGSGKSGATEFRLLKITLARTILAVLYCNTCSIRLNQGQVGHKKGQTDETGP
jgi:hypothetical protein